MYGECALCGKVTYLETHHIIPRVCTILGVDLDCEENLINICTVCHAKLTPRSVLTKYGQQKNMSVTNRIMRFYEILNNMEGHFDAIDVMDVFDEVFIGVKKGA